MKDFDIIERIKNKVQEMFKEENTGHDISHLVRVYEFASRIQEIEGGDPYVVQLSALVHDIHRLMSDKIGHFVFPEESLDEVEKLLLECDVDRSKLPEILEVVREHDNKDNKNVSLETLIIQDADALDAIGERGIERTLKYCKAHNIPLTNTNYSLETVEYIPDINPISTCHYIHNTMIPNARNLYTKTAKQIAEDKIQLLEDFVKKNYK